MRYRLVDLIVALVGVTLLCAIGVTWWRHVHRRSRLEACASNLRGLVVSTYNAYRRCPEHGDECFPHETGGSLHTLLYENDEIDDPAVFWCPARGQAVVGATHFRGPAADSNEYPARGFIGSDDPDNHLPYEPINAVTKAGDVLRLERGSPDYGRALKETAP